MDVAAPVKMKLSALPAYVGSWKKNSDVMKSKGKKP